MLIWAIMLTSLAIVITLPRESGIRTLVASVILRFIFSMGPEPTLWLLGSVTVLLKGIHIVSLMGNHGTLEKHFLSIITDAQLLYHLCYMLFCLSGILVHPFFYSILVRNKCATVQIRNETQIYLKKLSVPLQLFDVVYREETLLNVIRSVTRNGRSIILTAVLALILVYMFSIIGYIFFKDDFLVPVDDEIVPESVSDAKAFGSHMTHQQDDGQTVEPSEHCLRPDTEGVKNDGGERKERACDSLVMCILTTLNQGLRNGGGIGDILRAPSSTVSVRDI